MWVKGMVCFMDNIGQGQRMGGCQRPSRILSLLFDRSQQRCCSFAYTFTGRWTKKKREREGRGGEGRGGVQVVAVAAEQYRWFLLLLLFLFSRLVLHDLANVALRGIKTTPEAAFSL